MKTFRISSAQGDVLIRKIDKIPEDATMKDPENGQHVVSHSETGHSHALRAEGCDLFEAANDPMISYLRVVSDDVVLRHAKTGPDQHDSLKFPPGLFEIRRQREEGPVGWRPVQD